LFEKTQHQVPNVTLDVCEKFTSFLVEEDMTLPFIARYRKEEVGNLGVEELRYMKSSVEELQ
jgi:transcriptional accessory protein Tex/SPT6